MEMLEARDTGDIHIVGRIVGGRCKHHARVNARWWNTTSRSLAIPSPVAGRVLEIGGDIEDIDLVVCRLLGLVNRETKKPFYARVSGQRTFRAQIPVDMHLPMQPECHFDQRRGRIAYSRLLEGMCYHSDQE
jgi:hypothetical protein